jgi:dihydroorotate dehydrogenase
LEPETAHNDVLSIAKRFPWFGNSLGERPPQGLKQALFGRSVPSPIGLAAGFDKNGVALLFWERLGFGFVEVGTVTPRPQPGNPKPRITRLKSDHALINSMGFPSEGAEAVAVRFENSRRSGHWPKIPVAVNIGKNKATSAEDAHGDYATAARCLAPFADWLVVNVSSPNTPGLRALQAKDPLKRILGETLKACQDKPVLVKLSPDLADDGLEEAVQLARAEGIAGIVATNTTQTRPLANKQDLPQGGLSGRPLFELARGRLERILKSAGGLPVVGVGGVDSPERAAELLRLGCVAIQLYTGFVFEGPALLGRIHEALLTHGPSRLTEHGLGPVKE